MTKKELISKIQKNENLSDENVKNLKSKKHAELMDIFKNSLKNIPVNKETAGNQVNLEINIPEEKPEEKPEKPAPHWKEKRGWKTKLIKMVFSQVGGRIKRTTLARMINSDERNTHILISCIKRDTDFGSQEISWDKSKKEYTY